MTLEEKQLIVEGALAANPRFDHPVYRENLSRVAVETQIKKQEIEGRQFTTIFLTHNTIPSAYRTDPAFCITGDARYFKSLTFDEDFRIISIGVPHFFNLENFKEMEQFPEWQNSFRYIEKHDGTCFLITVAPDRFIVRSRRQIYTITSDLSCLDFPGYDVGTRIAALAEELRPRGVFTILSEAIFPHPAIRPAKLTPFYKQVMRGAGFCPFVDYPSQDNFFNGIVWHDSLRMETQSSLDEMCARNGIRRPKALRFECFEDTVGWLRRKQNAEGFCVYFNDDQSILKFKTRWYRRVRNTTGEIFALLKPSGVKFSNLASDEAKAMLAKAG
jgi:hypothetical protein